jgi:hypothetical protein
MSAAFFIVLEKKDVPFDTSVNGKFLSNESAQLETIARTLGISPLEEYISYSPEEARAMMEEFGADDDGGELPEQKWFDPQEGLDCAGKLFEYVQTNPDAVGNAEGVLSDLLEFKEVFKKADTVGSRWNLQVDF